MSRTDSGPIQRLRNREWLINWRFLEIISANLDESGSAFLGCDKIENPQNSMESVDSTRKIKEANYEGRNEKK